MAAEPPAGAAREAATTQRYGPADRRGWARRPWWPLAVRGFWAFFALGTLVLLVRMGRHLDWAGAANALARLPASTLWAALACAALSHLVFAVYDLFGRPLAPARRRQGGQPLPVRWMLAVGFVSFAVKLNLGTLVGGVALRYRLYDHLGLRIDEITRIVAASALTNWLGYMALAGGVLAVAPPALPASFGIGPEALRLGGVACAAVAAAYLAACWRWSGRQRRLFGHEFGLPSARLALLQLGLSAAHWLLMAAVCWLLLRQHVGFGPVLEALLVSAVAGLITHVPGGLGVIEAVFIGMLHPPGGQASVLAALLGFRALYYLLPLGLAALLYFAVEHRGRSTLAPRPTAG